MNIRLKPCWGVLALALGISACSTPPYFPPQKIAKPSGRAPVVDRSARRPARPSQAPLPTGPVPSYEEDPLLPREYSSSSPGRPSNYGYPPSASDAYDATPQPYPTDSGSPSPPPGSRRFAEDGYQSPAYPPGAATPYPAESRPNAAPGSLPEPQATVVPPTHRVRPPTAPPVPPPVAPTTPAPATPTPAPESLGAPAPDNGTVALATPPAVSTPEPAAPRPAQPAPPPSPPADLPPAEISRDGNQAVVALLESADKYVKGNQLDKAGAALERALRIEPRNAGIWHDLAQIRLHQGQYQQAESLATKSNNLAGGNRALQSRNWKLIGSARKAAGNAAGAEEAEAHASQLSH